MRRTAAASRTAPPSRAHRGRPRPLAEQVPLRDLHRGERDRVEPLLGESVVGVSAQAARTGTAAVERVGSHERRGEPAGDDRRGFLGTGLAQPDGAVVGDHLHDRARRVGTPCARHRAGGDDRHPDRNRTNLGDSGRPAHVGGPGGHGLILLVKAMVPKCRVSRKPEPENTDCRQANQPRAPELSVGEDGRSAPGRRSRTGRAVAHRSFKGQVRAVVNVHHPARILRRSTAAGRGSVKSCGQEHAGATTAPRVRLRSEEVVALSPRVMDSPRTRYSSPRSCIPIPDRQCSTSATS